ncbi:MAG TPA: GNAT family N-acetyltransferase [Oscillatoriaceae cyanobacterium]
MTLREFVLGDIPAIAAIRNASIRISPDFYSMTVDRFRFDFYDEDVPMTSRIMIAEEDGRTLGFYHLYTDENQLARGRVNLDAIHVHPDARGKGAGAALLESACDTAKGWKGGYVSTAIPEGDTGSLAFLERHGFSIARIFFKMRLSELKAAPEPVIPEGLHLRPYTPGSDEDAFVQVFNTCFEGHWDFTPLTPQEAAAWNRRPSFNPKGCFLLFDGPRLIGFTTILFDPERAAQTGEAVARIFEMGVLPEYRRRGLGYQLLLVGVRYARERGFQAIDLVTDSQNAPAVEMYEKLGFQDKRASLVLHRSL